MSIINLIQPGNEAYYKLYLTKIGLESSLRFWKIGLFITSAAKGLIEQCRLKRNRYLHVLGRHVPTVTYALLKNL